MKLFAALVGEFGVILATVAVQEGGYAIEAIGGCLDAFIDGFK